MKIFALTAVIILSASPLTAHGDIELSAPAVVITTVSGAAGIG